MGAACSDCRRRRLRHRARQTALGQLGIPDTIVEKNDGDGRHLVRNRYPGCGVDTPNHSYSFSFGPRNALDPLFLASNRKFRTILKKIAEDVRRS